MKLLFPFPSIYSIEKLKKIGDIQFSREPSHIIGTGGQATVFLGLSKGSIVAVKRITIDSLENEQKKKKVYRERDSFKNLNHRNIIKLIDYGENRTFM
jgi:serine/threonine protein kinase